MHLSIIQMLRHSVYPPSAHLKLSFFPCVVFTLTRQLPDFLCKVLAAKRRWQNMRKAAGKPIDNPNIVMNAAVQVCCGYSIILDPEIFDDSFTIQGKKLPDVSLFRFQNDSSLNTCNTDLDVKEKFWYVVSF
jgi:hypothetical protein